jgi:hypothetical protein
VPTNRQLFSACIAFFALALAAPTATQFSFAQEVQIAKREMLIDALDPGIKLFIREKMAPTATLYCSCMGRPLHLLAISTSNTRIIPGRTGS